MSRESTKRRIRGEERSQAAASSFTVTFADLSIVLLGFFVFLDALAVPDAIRRSGVLDSMSEHFTYSATPRDSLSARGANEIITISKQAGFAVEHTKERFVIAIPSKELFESGDDALRPSALPVLEQIAELILQFSLSVTIEGHTDNRPIKTARFPSNWELSAARAISVLRLFLEQGIPANRMSASGRGEFHPIADNETPEGRALNRRVVLVITGQQKNSEEGRVGETTY